MTTSQPALSCETEEHLFQAVIADPKDHATRLVYADWCEENGQDARAWFIRLQVETAEYRETRQQLPAESLYLQRQLWRENSRYWNAPLHRFLARHDLTQSSRRSPLRRWYYSGGFITALVLELDLLQEHASVLQQLGPIDILRLINIERQRIEWTPDALQLLRQVREVTLHPRLPVVRYLRKNPVFGKAMQDFLSLDETQQLESITFLNSDPSVLGGYLKKVIKKRKLTVRYPSYREHAGTLAQPVSMLEWLERQRLDSLG